MTDIQQKVALRRAIASSAFTMFMLVTVVGLFSLFSIWSINRAWQSGTTETNDLAVLSRTALDAQVAFKVQVQEWKNILLRGDEEELLEKYLASFHEQAAKTKDALSQVSTEAQRLGYADMTVEADSLVAMHSKVTERYLTELVNLQDGLPTLSATSARTLDRTLRGIDRELEGGIGALASRISDLAEARRASLTERLQDRYRTLRGFVMAVIAFSLLVTSYVLTSALRATRV